MVTRETLRDLGWEEIVSALARRTDTSRGRLLAEEIDLLERREAIEDRLDRVEEARTLARKELRLPLGGAEDVRHLARRAAKGGILEPAELMACARLLRAAARTRRFLEEHAPEVPKLAAEGAELVDAAYVAERIETSFEPSGRLRDDASAMLASLRDRVRSLHQRIQTELDRLLSDEAFAENLRESYVSIRNDRYVIPVNASFRGQVPGIVHNASNSGQTLFIEPQQIVGAGNELSIAESMVLEEERRILAELSGDVGDRAAEIEDAVERLGRLDFIQAAARLADDLDATRPRLVEGRLGFSLRQARHPILVLQGKEVVPNDIALEDDQRALVLSGPNAGGKTVTLTTVGLCSLLARAGLPIPADIGSEVPLFRAVRTAIGDDQDLEKDLSTFSAHLTSLREILETSWEGSLVLIDEIAADTDPREGAAIARAVLEALVAKGVQVVVTTHLEEIKALGMVSPRFANARVGLDPETLAPTFRLEMGRAGVSSALEIARRIGLPEPVVEAAREFLHGGSALAQALEQVEAEQRALARERQQLERQQAELRAAREEAEALRKELAIARAEVEVKVREELAAELEETRREVGAWVAKLSARPTVREAVEVQKKVQERIDREVREREKAKARTQLAKEAAPPPKKLRPGTRVKVASLGTEGEILEVHGDEVLVKVGILKTRVPVSDLVGLPGKVKPRKGTRLGLEKVAPGSELGGGARRLDVRGLRADDALRELEHFLDRAYSEGLSEVVVVHGLGSGALRQAIRSALEASPYAVGYSTPPQEEGGEGVTVVELRS